MLGTYLVPEFNIRWLDEQVAKLNKRIKKTNTAQVVMLDEGVEQVRWSWQVAQGHQWQHATLPPGQSPDTQNAETVGDPQSKVCQRHQVQPAVKDWTEGPGGGGGFGEADDGVRPAARDAR